jgi:hypothetical protein
MKNLKRSAFGLSFLIALLCLQGCKLGNVIEKDTYSNSDFTVVCLYGHKYIVRGGVKNYMAPKFDKNTHLPETCSIE